MKYDVLCNCGWGILSCEEENIPGNCPLCGYPIGLCDE